MSHGWFILLYLILYGSHVFIVFLAISFLCNTTQDPFSSLLSVFTFTSLQMSKNEMLYYQKCPPISFQKSIRICACSFLKIKNNTIFTLQKINNNKRLLECISLYLLKYILWKLVSCVILNIAYLGKHEYRTTFSITLYLYYLCMYLCIFYYFVLH